MGYNPAGLAWISAGIALTWVGLFCPIRWKREKVLSAAVCTAVFVWQIQQLYTDVPVLGVTPLSYYMVLIPILAASGVGSLLLERFSHKFLLPVFLGAFFVAGVLLLRVDREPFVDVFRVTTAACQGISRGENPYSVSFESPFPNEPKRTIGMFPPEYVVNGRVLLGYPYMPVSLAVAYAGYVVAGDFRYGNLAALTIAAGLLAYCRCGKSGAAGACLLLTTPKVWRVLDFGWSEPAIALCLAAVIFCASRSIRKLSWATGLLLVSKQHMLLTSLFARLLGRLRWRIVAVVAAGATVPFILWNPHAFWHSAVQEQLEFPFRLDSLNFASAWVRLGHAPPLSWMSIALGVAAVMVVQKAGRSTAKFAGAIAAVYLMVFALAGRAFLNYYFLVVTALCCAVSAESEGEWKV
jgi:hypothetical protein